MKRKRALLESSSAMDEDAPSERTEEKHYFDGNLPPHCSKLDTAADSYLTFEECNVSLDLELQVWNIDERVIKDKNHNQRPINKYKILHKEVFIQEEMSTYGHMHHIENLLRFHAQLMQN